jgi:predicted PurR-regulated permease PerM
MNSEAKIPSKSSFTATPRSTLASWILIGIALFLMLKLHLLSALMAGLLTYELVRLSTPLVDKRLTSSGARLVALATLSVLTITLLILLTIGIFAFLKSDTGNRQALLDKTNHIFAEARTKLPPWIADNLPSNKDAMKFYASEWVSEHSKDIRQTGKEVVQFFVRGLVGMVIGALISLHPGSADRQMRPVATALALRVSRFANAFRLIISAQVKISAINAFFTGIFLVGILPAFGVHLPLTKTLIAIAFLAGLLPIVGNLFTNTLICIVALSISIYVALAALIFSVVIHKLEYFLNAKIVGAETRSRAWELLAAMILFEAAFGVAGLIAAPLYYAYIKNELLDADLI